MLNVSCMCQTVACILHSNGLWSCWKLCTAGGTLSPVTECAVTSPKTMGNQSSCVPIRIA